MEVECCLTFEIFVNPDNNKQGGRACAMLPLLGLKRCQDVPYPHVHPSDSVLHSVYIS